MENELREDSQRLDGSVVELAEAGFVEFFSGNVVIWE